MKSVVNTLSLDLAGNALGDKDYNGVEMGSFSASPVSKECSESNRSFRSKGARYASLSSHRTEFHGKSCQLVMRHLDKIVFPLRASKRRGVRR